MNRKMHGAIALTLGICWNGAVIFHMRILYCTGSLSLQQCNVTVGGCLILRISLVGVAGLNLCVLHGSTGGGGIHRL